VSSLQAGSIHAQKAKLEGQQMAGAVLVKQ
jgi:hypothetical protein